MIIGGINKLSLIDYKGKLSAVIFTQGCNFRCMYCHNPELLPCSDKSVISEQEVFDFLKSRVGKLDAVVISGGEPCLQDGLVEFIKKIKELGFLLKLDTNGSYPDKLEELLRLGLLDYIAMDIKAPLLNYEQIIQSKISSDNILRSIEFVKKSGIEYEFRTTVMRDFLDVSSLDGLSQLLSGARLYYLQKFKPSKILEAYINCEKFIPSDKEMREGSNYLSSFVGKVEIR